MKKEAKDKHFIHKPSYEGGPRAMKQFIGENLRYPQEALDNKVEGTVYVRYDIDHQGKVTDAKVVAGIGHGCDEEAVRLVKSLEFKVPKNRGVRVVFHKNLQVHFRLPKAKPAQVAAPLNINYTVTEPVKKDKEGNSFTYTINL